MIEVGNYTKEIKTSRDHPTAPMLVSILGLPCSGTTILNKFVNSMDNGFILCEPIRVNHQYHNSYSDDLRAQIKRHIKKVTGYAKYKLKYINKPDQLELTTPENYYEEIYNYAVEHGHHFAGLKETYDHSRPFILESILTEPYDIHLFSFRDPLATFNSWKQKKQW